MKPLEQIRLVLWTGKLGNLGTVEDTLKGLGCRVQRMNSFEQLRTAIEAHQVDVLAVACNSARPVLSWLRGTPAPLHTEAPPVLTLASAFDVDLYLEAMRLGAYDCVGLPLAEKELVRLVSQAAELHRSRHLAVTG